MNYNPHPDIFDCPREVEDNGEWYYQMRQEEGEKGLLEWAYPTDPLYTKKIVIGEGSNYE
ncbi:hypothetical protein [Paenibacillus sp. ISL-20]|uniref:hypothetical protein n=1 Tax=Paenibacillus sp. ISL-20 TaxID=2819163 RepID=UPI001BEC49D9|nr:hypothetical protein [Paenibacillus sp. ISL-20]MBT2765785.1 hypothetical protein [Paenibacillus sp. ISL-20]